MYSVKEGFYDPKHSWEGMPDGEPIPGKSYRADGWYYLDMPGKFEVEAWHKMLQNLGKEDEHYVVLIQSEGTTKEGQPWKRGQLLVSPDGMENFVKSIRKH